MDSSGDHKSYLKTIALAALVLGIAASTAILLVLIESGDYILRWTVAGLAALVAIASATIVAGGIICLRREANQERGIGWTPRPSVRRARRRRKRGAFQVGEWVEVRSAEEILDTLDDSGALESLPFMPEMLAQCGKRFQVTHRADKILDMISKTGVRRMRRAVFLGDVRCDGSAHDGCQQGCRIIWKMSWVRRVDSPEAETGPSGVETRAEEKLLPLTRRRDIDGKEDPCYRCQATELLAASAPMHGWDPRAELRALATGNVRLGDFVLVLLMRAFNFTQELRGGSGFPAYGSSGREKTPQELLDLRVGEIVEVKNIREIEMTLDSRGRNRGMRFDREMVRYCGGRYRVQSRVERIIDEKSGRMLKLRNPCIILEGVVATGEFLRFNPQLEFPYWREIWLRRVGSESRRPEGQAHENPPAKL